MTEQDDTITIRASFTGDGKYKATLQGHDGQMEYAGETMAEALSAAVDELAPFRRYGVQVKVRAQTQVSAEELIALLEALAPDRPDLGGCDLSEIDLSPDALDRMRYPEALRAQATRGIFLWGAQLQFAALGGAQLQGAVLTRAQLQGAFLVSAQLQGAFLADAQLQGANLRHAQLQGASLSGAQLQGAFLRWADVREVDLRGAATLNRVRWHNARLEKTWLYRHQIEPVGDEVEAATSRDSDRYRDAMETYLVLKTNFQSLGNYEDAAWAYVKEQQMEKMALYWEWRSSGWAPWRNWRSFLRWLRNWAYELLTGYGERPQNPVIGGALVMAAFALGYWLTGAVAGLMDALVYSVATFATFNLGRPGLNPEGRGVELASSVEALLGISVLALVIYTLGNRMSRS